MRDYTNTILAEEKRSGYAVIGRVLLALMAALAVALVVIVTLLLSGPASAEVTSESQSGVDFNATLNSGAAAFGGGATINETQQAPGLGGLALGGGHPCQWSPATAQVSVLGGGAGIGGGKIDSACMLTVLGAASGDKRAYTAAGAIIAGRDPAACRAMREVGMISAESDCEVGGGLLRPRKDFSTKATTASSKNTGWGVKCDLQGRKLVFQPTSKAARDAELSACKTLYGL